MATVETAIVWNAIQTAPKTATYIAALNNTEHINQVAISGSQTTLSHTYTHLVAVLPAPWIHFYIFYCIDCSSAF